MERRVASQTLSAKDLVHLGGDPLGVSMSFVDEGDLVVVQAIGGGALESVDADHVSLDLGASVDGGEAELPSALCLSSHDNSFGRMDWDNYIIAYIYKNINIQYTITDEETPSRNTIPRDVYGSF